MACLGKHRNASAATKTVARAAVVGTAALAPFGVAPTSAQAATANWDAVAQCESSGDWHADTGNGLYGGLQFDMRTWEAYGGQGQPQNTSREYQIEIAENVKKDRGMSPWPNCGSRG